MTCNIPGCYAKPFSKNLCRNHFYMWRDQTATAPMQQKERPSELPRRHPRNPHNEPPYNGPCRCERPFPESLGAFGGQQCAACGMPIYERKTNEAV